MSSLNIDPTPVNPAPALPHPGPLPVTLRTQESLSELLEVFQSLFPRESLALWLKDHVFYNRGFTPLIVLWYSMFQFLSAKRTLEEVLEDARDGGADRLSPPGKAPLSQTLRSDSTASWSDARRRLPTTVLQQAVRFSGQRIGAFAPQGWWHGLEPALLDGTTIRLRPLGDVAQKFPPHGGGRAGTRYWCLARSVVAFSLATGAVLDTAVGSLEQSEQALTMDLWQGRLWPETLFVGDRNFGVYSVVRAARGAQAHILVRLTEARAQKLAREAGVSLEEGADHLIEWKPTSRDHCPEHLTKEPVAGRLLAVRVSRPNAGSELIYLFTTCVDPQITPEEWAQLYAQRWQVELNLRYVKTQMGLHFLNCRSAEMAHKLWLGGLLAYNVVRAAMAMAAARSGQSVAGLSFSRTRKALVTYLPKLDTPKALSAWERLLERIARFRLPVRKRRRPAEPRAQRHFQSPFPKLRGDRAEARKTLAKTTPKS